MAEAKITTTTVKTIALTLTVEEAETIMAVGAMIGGDLNNTPRRHYASAVSALRKAGVRDFDSSGPHPYRHVVPGSVLTFTEKPRTSPHRIIF
ncbi:hypothetical protein [Streptomyces sp. NPDC005955]|uniref:hypothetical protein n=1 Tax=Streptomyces sp. NPDC005955 TaxID=3364738 RepID=UPI003693CF3F